MTRVSVESGGTWASGTPETVLDQSYVYGGAGSTGRMYDVARDGRLLMIKQGDGSTAPAGPQSIVVVLNWEDELRRLVPAK